MADQLISTAVHDKLPESYVRPETQRPRLDEVVPDAHIPVVDLANPDRATVVSQIGAACASHGFFQVLNHGIPLELMLAVTAVAHEFFRLPPEEKAKLYSDDPAKETVHNWRDYLRLHCHPLEQFVPDWPANPPYFREIMSTYCKEVRALGFRLYGAISESLGLEEGYLEKVLGEQEQHMAVNFYPKCPEPELTYGLPAHMDPNALTILLMDQPVAGLQVLKEGKWIAVNPRPNALIINIGDQLQALLNSLMERSEGGDETPRDGTPRGRLPRVVAEVLAAVREIQGRHDAVREVERSLLEFRQMLLDMAVMVESQGEHLDDIRRHVESASNYVVGGNKELGKAREYQRSSRSIGIIVLLLLVLLVIVPIAT